MPHTLGNHDALAGREIDRAVLQIDQEPPTDDVEELILALVMMSVIFAVHDAEAHHGFVHLTESLIVPLIGAGRRQSRHIDDLERRVQNVQSRIVRKSRG